MLTPRAPFACDPYASRGRLHAEPDKGVRGPRSAFQRDRDRIIHSIAFRRLRHKTQVFVAPDGDHFRVRLTHSLEVAQIGRTIARALGLDEDLTEALCLAHDIGHPPFGHAGEAALEAATLCAGGFDHNGHSLRILMRLECPYPAWDGLNLSWEMLEGLAKHNGPIFDPGWALAQADAAFPLDLARHASLEAQIAAIADDIAYDNHDVDDGLRAGLLDFDDLLTLEPMRLSWDRVRSVYPEASPRRQRAEMIRQNIGIMVNDVIASTRQRIADYGIESQSDVRMCGVQLGGFSEQLAISEKMHKRFMYDRLYHHPSQMEAARISGEIVKTLFAAYEGQPMLLPEEWHSRLSGDPVQRTRHIADFIAGMTDRFAIARYRDLAGPLALPEGF